MAVDLLADQTVASQHISIMTWTARREECFSGVLQNSLYSRAEVNDDSFSDLRWPQLDDQGTHHT